MAIYTNENFKQRQILLDGNEYRECIFTDCELVYSGGELPKLVGGRATSCNFVLDGPARRTQLFWMDIYRSGATDVVEMFFDSIRGK